MLVTVLGSHLAAAFVGVGITALVFGCAKVASTINAQAAKASKLSSVGWHLLRVLVGLLCAASISLPWLYLLIELRISLTAVVALVLGLVVSAFLFIKFGIFGRVTFIGH